METQFARMLWGMLVLTAATRTSAQDLLRVPKILAGRFPEILAVPEGGRSSRCDLPEELPGVGAPALAA